MRKLMEIPAVCETTGLKPPTIRAWANARRIASVKLGRRLLIPEDEVEKLIERNYRPAAPERVHPQKHSAGRTNRRQTDDATADVNN